MNLRAEIQKLAIWYIPVSIIALLVSTWYSGLLKEALISGGIESVANFMNAMSMIPLALEVSVHAVVAIWLYYLINKTTGNKYVWFLFGLLAHLYAVVIYIGLVIYEKQASNNTPQPTPKNGAAEL